MPFYEYRCTQCSHYLEVLQKISEEPLKQCPKCRDNSLKRLISLSAFRLKGQGWYETDFKHGEKQKSTTNPEQTASKSSADDMKSSTEERGPSSTNSETSTKKADSGTDKQRRSANNERSNSSQTSSKAEATT